MRLRNGIFTLLLALALLGTLPDLSFGSADGPWALLEALRNASDTDRRQQIIHDLGKHHSDAVRLALERIADNTKEPPAVRMSAICSLAGSATKDSVPLLIDLTETDLAQRHGYWACSIPLLGQLRDRRALPLLMRIANLNQEHLAGMDHMAIAAVATMADAREVPFLVAKAHIWPVRPVIIEALARIASPASIETLISGLQDSEEPETVAAAQRGLKKIGRKAVPALKKALTWPSGPIFKRRIRSLLNAIR